MYRTKNHQQPENIHRGILWKARKNTNKRDRKGIFNYKNTNQYTMILYVKREVVLTGDFKVKWEITKNATNKHRAEIESKVYKGSWISDS